MGETLPAVTVRAARRALQDTSRLSPERVAALEQVVIAFQALRPRDRACVACGSMRWSEHTDGADESVWACASCHRSAGLTPAAWWAQCQAAEAVRMAQDAAEDAAAPEPRAALAEALDRRAEATAALDRLEQALPAARTALASAQARHDSAVAAMAEAEQGAVARHVASLTGIKAEAAGVTQGAARGQLRTAEDALSAARGAKALLDGQAEQAARNLANTHDGVHAAALAVLVVEELEPLIESAINARAAYLTSVSELAFLLRLRAVPAGDARPAQLVREADTAPALWPESAAAAAALRLTARLARLEE